MDARGRAGNNQAVRRMLGVSSGAVCGPGNTIRLRCGSEPIAVSQFRKVYEVTPPSVERGNSSSEPRSIIPSGFEKERCHEIQQSSTHTSADDFAGLGAGCTVRPAIFKRGAGGKQQSPAPGVGAGQRAQRREQMQAMCKEHIATMKTDVQKMHSAFDKMKGNVASISNADEKARWQANVDMWQTVVDHHDQMLKHMEDAQAKGMGCGMMMSDMGMGGMMHHHGMGPMKPAPAAPAETKPQ